MLYPVLGDVWTPFSISQLANELAQARLITMIALGATIVLLLMAVIATIFLTKSLHAEKRDEEHGDDEQN